MASRAAPGNTVRVHYTGKLDDGTVFDSSRDDEPLEFTLGTGQVIPGFEAAVVGLAVGEVRSARLAPDDAYGERDDDMMLEVARSMLPADLDPKVGETLTMQEPGGNVVQVVVAKIGEEVVVLDANHPLAGKPLTFELELVEIV